MHTSRKAYRHYGQTYKNTTPHKAKAQFKMHIHRNIKLQVTCKPSCSENSSTTIADVLEWLKQYGKM